jgi:hypothetical protein
VRWHEQALLASGTIGFGNSSPELNFTARSENISLGAVLAGLNRRISPHKETSR